jgi:hypothetical protein
MISQQGALNTTALVVPDLYVQIVSPAVLLNGVPSNVLGVVGSAAWGPVNQAVTLGTMADYATAFGAVMNRTFDMGTHVAIAVQQGAAAFRCVRVTDGSETAATVSNSSIAFTALYPGSLGSLITVTLTAGAKVGSWAANVALPGVGLERFDNVVGTGAAFWAALALAINTGNGQLRGASLLVVATPIGGTAAPGATQYALSGGSDGAAALTAGDLLGQDTAARSGMYALRNQGCALLDLCDCDDPTQWTTVDGFAAAEGMYAILTGPPGDTIGGAVATKQAAGLDSTATKLLFGDWLYWWDAVNGTERLVSPQAFAAGRLANLSPEQSGLNKPLYAIGGSQKVGPPQSGLSNCYSAAELQAIFAAGIDLITNPGAGGQAIWTLRLGHNSSSNAAVNGDNYTRLTNYIAATLEAGMGLYVGLVINAALLRNIRSTLMAFLSALQSQGMIGTTDGSTAFAVICDTINNPPTRLALGYVQADAQIRYQGINEKFLVNLDGGVGVLVTSTNTASSSGGGSGSGPGGGGTGGTASVTVSAPGSATAGTALALSGTVSPSGSSVSVALSGSGTVLPSSGFVAATVSSGTWSAHVTPAAAGTVFAWAKTSTTGITGVSAAITVAAASGGGTASVTVTAPGSGTAGTALALSGTVAPSGSSVSVALSGSGTVPPTSGFVAATVSGGTWSASVTPSAAGTLFAWADTSTTGVTGVSAAITVSAAPSSATLTWNLVPAGPYTAGQGGIGANALLHPGTAATGVQFGWSSSASVAPTVWATGTLAATEGNGDTLWAAFINAPATAGTYFAWVESVDGAEKAVTAAVTVT